MQPQRQATQNLVYWPVTLNNKYANNMSKEMSNLDKPSNIANLEVDNNRWHIHMSAVAMQRDKSAYRSLYLHFAPKVKSFYLQQNLRQHAEEMTHEVFLKVWQKAASFDADKAQVSTWIFTIARNLKIDMLRKKSITEVNEEEQIELASDENIEETIDTQREQLQFSTMFKLLNEEQRNVIQKVYFEDKSHQATSDELGLTLGEVKSRVRSALNILRSQLGGEK